MVHHVRMCIQYYAAARLGCIIILSEGLKLHVAQFVCVRARGVCVCSPCASIKVIRLCANGSATGFFFLLSLLYFFNL